MKALMSGMASEELKMILKAQYKRQWNIHIDPFKLKWQFLRYAGRYFLRPPISQSRFVSVTEAEVHFRTKDLKEKGVVLTRYSSEKFVGLLGEHVRDRYQNAMRYFGLLAPGSKHQTSAALFALLGQENRSRPHRLSWQNSLRKLFGRDPLLDSCGQSMHWARRLKPVTV